MNYLVMAVAGLLAVALAAHVFGYTVNQWQREVYTHATGFEFHYVQKKLRIVNLGLFSLHKPVPRLGPPTDEQAAAFQRVYDAALLIWSREVCALIDLKPRVWFVDRTDQYVWHGSILPWNQTDKRYGDGSTNPEGGGYSGLTLETGELSHPSIYIATYHVGRSVTALLVHEMTHLVNGLREHDADFLRLESELRTRVFM